MKRLLLASLLLLGCGRPASSPQGGGPYYLSANSLYQDPGSNVKLKPVSQVGYTVSRRCAQGPLELEIPALGDPIGEYVWFELRGPRHVNGSWDGKHPPMQVGYSGTFGTGAKSENERCVAPEQVGGSAPAGAPGSPGNPGGSAKPGEPPPAPSGEVVVFTKADSLPPLTGKYAFQIVVRVDASLKAGEKIHIRLWSDTPQDWEGYVGWLEQGRLLPDDPVKWAAGREEEKKKEAETHAASNARVDRINKCRSILASTKVWPPECEAEFPGMPQKEAAQDACWQVWNAKKIWTDACRALTNVDPSNEKPYGAPPAAPADPKPPQPSVHAEWVPGSYHASGTSWTWSPGLWKVPKTDIDSGQTAKAPSAPPPPKPEVQPPKPSPNAVWCGGWWAFSLSGWVWIEGAWRVPPFPGSTWRAYVWVSMGAAFTLVPGGWITP